MAAAAEGWRDWAGCRLCGKPARTGGEKQRLPSSVVECTLLMLNPESEWLHGACRSKVAKSASVARREPAPSAPRRSSRGRAPDPEPEPRRAAQGGWQGDEQMLASSFGSFWTEQHGTSRGCASGQSARSQTSGAAAASSSTAEACELEEACALAAAAAAAAEATTQAQRMLGGAQTAELWASRREAGLAPPPRSAPLGQEGRTCVGSKVKWSALTHDEAVTRGKKEAAARAANATKLINALLRAKKLEKQLKSANEQLSEAMAVAAKAAQADAKAERDLAQVSLHPLPPPPPDSPPSCLARQ